MEVYLSFVVNFPMLRSQYRNNSHALSSVVLLHHVQCLFVFLTVLIGFPTIDFQHFKK